MLFYHPLNFGGVRRTFPQLLKPPLSHIHCSLQQAKLRGVFEAAVGPASHCCVSSSPLEVNLSDQCSA